VSESLVSLHVIVRWLILGSAAAGIAAILLARRRGGWDRTAHFWTQVYAWLLGLQSVIGIVLWVDERRWEGGDTFLSFIHPAVMLVAVGVAHGGLAHAYRQQDPQETNRRALTIVVITSVIVLVTIPWFVD
jgi:hypothetical protein